MARNKRLSEISPPSASSFEEEDNDSREETESDDQEIEHLPNDQVVDGENQVEVVDDDDGADDRVKEKVLKKHTDHPNPDSDADFETTPPSPSPSAFTIKLHKPSPKPNKTGSKRPAESESKSTPSRKKCKADDEEPKKGSAIQRLWSEDDELAILDGMNQYRSEKGTDPYADMGAFHDFIKKSLHVDVAKSQLIDKIRRLKKKYKTNIERGENGQDPVFSKTHDLKSFELSKKIWGGDEGNNGNVKRSGKVENNGGGDTLGLLAKRQMRDSPSKSVNKAVAVKREDNNNVAETNQVKKEDKSDDLWEKYPFLSESLNNEDMSEGMKMMVREELGMIEKEKLKELEEKWRSLKQSELELFVQRRELVQEELKLTLHSINSYLIGEMEEIEAI